MPTGKTNRYYHAILGEILKSNVEKIKYKNSVFSAEICIPKVNIYQLKFFFKLIDTDFKKTANTNIGKYIFQKEKHMQLIRFFGNPVSIKDLSDSELYKHIKFIIDVCKDNGITLKSNDSYDPIKSLEERGVI